MLKEISLAALGVVAMAVFVVGVAIGLPYLDVKYSVYLHDMRQLEKQLIAASEVPSCR